jgi:ribosomal protein S18 acetylase RimI-like enzyme
MKNIEIRLIKEDDIPNMKEIIEDDGMVYNADNIIDFVKEENNYGFIILVDNKIVGLSYCYNLLRLDGKKMLYMHSIGILKEYQNQGLGTKLVQYIVDYGKANSFSECFVITDKGNPRACHVYEKVGGKNDYEDEIFYVFNY